MTTHDNALPPADWLAQSGNRCAGCDASANLCHCLKVLPGEIPCCHSCTHVTMPEPKVWNGSD